MVNAKGTDCPVTDLWSQSHYFFFCIEYVYKLVELYPITSVELITLTECPAPSSHHLCDLPAAKCQYTNIL